MQGMHGVMYYAGNQLMLNGKVKSHDELWYALLEAEKLFATKDPQVRPDCATHKAFALLS